MRRKDPQPPKNVLSVRFRQYIDRKRSELGPDFEWSALGKEYGFSRDVLSRLYHYGADAIRVQMKTRKQLYKLTGDPLLDPRTWQDIATLEYDSPRAQMLVGRYARSPAGHQAESERQGSVAKAGGLEQEIDIAALQEMSGMLGRVKGSIDTAVMVAKRALVQPPEYYRNLAKENPTAFNKVLAEHAYALAYALLAVGELGDEAIGKLKEALPAKELAEISYLLQHVTRPKDELDSEREDYRIFIKLEKGPYKII